MSYFLCAVFFFKQMTAVELESPERQPPESTKDKDESEHEHENQISSCGGKQEEKRFSEKLKNVKEQIKCLNTDII